MPLRHALEVRHASFDDPAFIALAKASGAAIVYADHPEYPCIDADTGDFSYARLMQAREDEPTGYSPTEIEAWADKARAWAGNANEVYMFFINGAKVRAPAAAMALIEQL